MEDLKVCIIGIYFGQFPNYFDLWLKSASYNYSIDFLIFTNQIVVSKYKNIKFINMNINELRSLSEEKLKMKVKLYRPYKCCDLRPAFGIIFSDYIAKYDYWGYCDFDLIWGDIKSFISKYNMQNYDRFLPNGHLGFYKNTIANNERFKIKPSNHDDFHIVFSSEENYAFDEHESKEIYLENNFSFFIKRIFADISIIYKRYRLALNDVNYNEQIFYWQDGKVYRDFKDENLNISREEFIYIHFKERGFLNVNEECLNASKFYISYNGFFPENNNTFEKNLDSFNKYPGALFETSEFIKYKIENRIKKIFKILKGKFGIVEKIR